MLKGNLFLGLLLLGFGTVLAQAPLMQYGDATGIDRPFSKDPFVLKFKGRYLMYYTMRKPKDELHPKNTGLVIGIAESHNLTDWKKIGEITPEAVYEKRGLCAPGAVIRDGKVHLFYQNYGYGANNAICHAVSRDGVHFTRDPTNPVFHPKGDWTNGRAIDAEVVFFKGKYFMYFATRDPHGSIQKLGVATAPGNTDFSRQDWTQASDHSVLKPELSWEGKCIEAPSVVTHQGQLFMFYAGNYNNKPQQIGLAFSQNGIDWYRLSNVPFLANGKPGTWNSSESGHPDIFKDTDGKTYLFYQGNNDNGRTWYLSNVKIGWRNSKPYILKK